MLNYFYDKFIIRKKFSKLDLDIMKKNNNEVYLNLNRFYNFFQNVLGDYFCKL